MAQYLLDGILGMGFKWHSSVEPRSRAPGPSLTASSRRCRRPSSRPTLSTKRLGWCDFGLLPRDRYQGEIAYVPVDNKRGFWNFTPAGFGIGNDEFVPTPLSGVCDVGTTLLLLDDRIVHAYYIKVNGAYNDTVNTGDYVFPCNETVPSFSFKVGDNTSTIPSQYLNYTSVGARNERFGGIQPNGGFVNVLGDMAIKAAYLALEDGPAGPRLGWDNTKLL